MACGPASSRIGMASYRKNNLLQGVKRAVRGIDKGFSHAYFLPVEEAQALRTHHTPTYPHIRRQR